MSLLQRLSVVTTATLAVASLASAQTGPVTVETTSGETIKGEFVVRGEKEAIIKSDAAGVVTVPVSKIRTITNAGGEAVQYVPVGEPGLFGSDVLSGWTKTFDFGFNGAATPTADGGTSDSASLNTGLTFSNDNADYRSTFGARYWLATVDGNKSQNAFRAYGTYDKYLKDVNPKLFVFGRAQYDFDEIQAFYQRVSGFGGVGYDFIKRDNYTMSGRVGLGATQDFGRAETDDFRVEALAGIDGKWVIDPRQTFNYSFYFFPSLSDFSDGRVVSNVWYEATVDHAKGLALRLGLEHKYEFRTNEPTGFDTGPNDFKYYANLVLKF